MMLSIAIMAKSTKRKYVKDHHLEHFQKMVGELDRRKSRLREYGKE